MKRRFTSLARLAVLGALCPMVALCLPTATALAHPMGNFSINHFSSLRVQPNHVDVLYVADIAEIPTFQELSSLSSGAGHLLTGTVRTRYLQQKAKALSRELSLTWNGKPLSLRLRASDLIFPPGAGGLPTERIYLALEAPLPRSGGTIGYRDRTFPGHTGWKEIVAAGARVTDSSVPSRTRSQALTVYPAGIISSPPQDRDASLRLAVARVPAQAWWAAGAIRRAEAPLFGPQGGWSALARGLAAKGRTGSVGFAAGRSDPLSDLIATQTFSGGLLLLSLVVAFWFGAGHALSPGHGKTMVAAYLVGSRGTPRQAVILGLTVTMTHTAGVFALGLVTLYLSKYILPDQLYPWLGALSGLLVAGMGGSLFVRRGAALRRASTTARAPRTHRALSIPIGREMARSRGYRGTAWYGQSPDGYTTYHQSKRGQGEHRHGPFGRVHTHAPAGEAVSMRSLIGLGISGGILPCPSALIVLLSAIAFHRVALGMLLIVAFSLGLAATLTGIGLLVVWSGRVASRLSASRHSGAFSMARHASRVLPVVSALFVAAIGTAIAVTALEPLL